MFQESINRNSLDLAKEFADIEGVCFDAENVRLEGVYNDELSAFRARKIWKSTLAANFLLEDKEDFKFAVQQLEERKKFVLRCDFLTACARHAFWRLINNQTPEAQYIIETAHIAVSQLRNDDFIFAPDLAPKTDEPTILRSTRYLERPHGKKTLKSWLKKLLRL